MTDTLASAVALPEPNNPASSPDADRKRRQSSTGANSPEGKRRRLSSQDPAKPQSHSAQDGHGERERKPSVYSTDEKRRGRGGRDEERKRGQRLFGGLLGTLSQSNPATQKRRADIERRQQDKLKLQDEEYGEKKRRQKDEVVARRKRETRGYEEEAMRTRHASLRAMAGFLKTRTEPVLHYKPWRLQREDEDTIDDQIDEAEATISREVSDFEARRPQEEPKEESRAEATEEKDEAPAPDTETKEIVQDGEDASKNETQAVERSGVPKDDGTAVDDDHAAHPQEYDHRAEDDGGEVVEDKEDTVIY